MSEDQTTTDQTTDEAPVEAQSTVGDQTPDEATDERHDRNAEAKKYRLRLRDVEAERDQLAATVDKLRRAGVEDRLKAQRVPAAGFWASGVQVADLLTDDGDLDDEAITTAAENAVKTLGLQRVGTRAPVVPAEGRTTTPSPTTGWTDAFRPN